MSVLLGFTDKVSIIPKNVKINYNFNILGGKNILNIDPICIKCKKTTNLVAETSKLTFILQIYCPIDEFFHRTLYIFQCNICNHWLILRKLERNDDSSDNISEIENLSSKIQEKVNFNEDYSFADDFSEDITPENSKSNDWGESPGDSSVENEFKSDWDEPEFVCDISKSKTNFIKSDKSNLEIDFELFPEQLNNTESSIFPPKYIEVETESEIYSSNNPLDDDDDEDGSVCASYTSATSYSSSICSLNEILNENQNSNFGILDDKITEKYEKLNPQHGDISLYKFIEYIRYCPEQILRYSINRDISNAIPYNDACQKILNDENQIKSIKCRHCNSKCSFELQILPQSIYDLSDRVESKKSQTLPEFGSIYIFTCDKNCWDEDKNEVFRMEADPIVVIDHLKC